VNRVTIKVPPIHRCTPNPLRVTKGVSAFSHLLSTAFCAYFPRPFRSLAPSAPRMYGGPYSAFMAPTYREDRQYASHHHWSTWREVSKSGPEQDRPFSFRRDRNKPCKLFRLCSRLRILACPLATRQIHVCDQAVGRAYHDRPGAQRSGLLLSLSRWRGGDADAKDAPWGGCSVSAPPPDGVIQRRGKPRRLTVAGGGNAPGRESCP
jgi:hypothetical protein